MVDWPRPEVMRHMAHPNVAISTTRSVETGVFQHALVADRLITHHSVSIKEVNYLFPLYLYPDTSKQDLFSHTDEVGERKPNLNLELVSALTHAYKREPTAEQILHYVYGVLYSPSYRELYNDFLKTDFPRIPFTADGVRFRDMAALGEQLTALHLLKSPELDPPLARFNGEGDARVAKNKSAGFRYDPDEERVWINDAQFFEPVAPELWEYRIGGYQVLEKWLKDRRDRQLSLDEIRTYCRIVTAIAKTIELQEQIDELYAGVEEAVVEIGYSDGGEP
jgi:predicted helicase